MPLNLSAAFGLVPGIYVIGPRNPRTGRGFWKVGLASSIRDRLSDYQICFPEGFIIRLLLTLPTPEGQWRQDNIRRAITLLERTIHSALKKHEDVEHVVITHKRSEWFRATFPVVQAVIIDVVTELGLNEYARVHTDLASVKYGPTLDGQRPARIPKGDSASGLKVAPDVSEFLPDLSGREKTAVEALMDMSRQAPLDPRLRATHIPLNPSEDREYTVDRIVDDRVASDGSTEYKVRWRGYAPGDDTWERRETLAENAAERVAEYEDRRQRDTASNLMSLAQAAVDFD